MSWPTGNLTPREYTGIIQRQAREIHDLRADLKYASEKARHWHENHNHQVKVKRRISENYGRLLRSRHAGLIGRLRKACGR